MASFDIFNADPFKVTEMVAAINRQPRVQTLLGSGGLNLFGTKRVRTETVFFEDRDGVISLIQTSERGTDPQVETEVRSTLRVIRPPRLADAFKLTASEIADIRAFGTESEMKQVAAEIATRQERIRMNFELTWENMRLGSIQGIMTDADSTTLFNWFTFWGVNQPAEIDFDLDNATPASGALYKNCNTVRTQMYRAAKGAWFPSTIVYGLCDDLFWRDLITHKEAIDAYRMQASAGSMAVAGTLLENMETFRYGGITFLHYLGTDDGTTVGIPTSTCKFFPGSTPGVFEVAYAPGEFFGVVNQPGQELYARMVMDPSAGGMAANARWMLGEMYSYPLFYCTRPLMLQRAKRT